MKITALRLIYLIILTSVFSCNSHRPIVYSKNYSQGFYKEGDIYFLLDYKVWSRGRAFWFIMPVEGRQRIHFREIYIYRYNPDSNELKKLAVLHKDFISRNDVRYSRFIQDESQIVFAYNAGYDDSNNRLFDIFIWDTKSDKFNDTGFKNPVSENNPFFKEHFSDYKSPWTDNPGIIDISRLKNEILYHLSDKDYMLPEKW